MAQTLSTKVTSASATPRVVLDTSKQEVQFESDLVTVAANTNGDTAIVHVRVPVDAMIKSIRVGTDDMGSGTTMSVGLFSRDGVTGSTFTAVSAAAFASAIDVATAATAMTDYRFNAKGIATVNQKAWELAGLSAKPDYSEFWVGLTFPAAVTATGNIAVTVDSVVAAG